MTLQAVLAATLAPRMLVLEAMMASVVAVHLRGRERLSLRRQLTDHSTFMVPYNVLVYLLSAVPNEPYLDLAWFPKLAPLKENWRTIRNEAVALYDQERIKRSENYDDLAFNSFFRIGWKRFYLKWYGESHPSARALCPTTVELLETIPSVRAAMFALLPPHSRHNKHRDPFAGSLCYHLGLVTPNSDECRIRVDGQPYTWRDGEAVVFDETFLHRAENNTDQARIILFCDIERPLRGRIARAANRLVGRTFVSAAATANEQGEKIGALNKIFGKAYQLRIWGKRVKKANRTAYYALKFALVGALIYLIFVA